MFKSTRQWFIDDAKAEQMKHPLPKALRAKFFADAVVDANCPGSDGSGLYDLHFSKNGVGFSEEGEMGSGCERVFLLSIEEAMPFANKWGQSQLKLLAPRAEP